MMRACAVCLIADDDVIVLSSGFPIHKLCWPHVTSDHVKSPRSFGRPTGDDVTRAPRPEPVPRLYASERHRRPEPVRPFIRDGAPLRIKAAGALADWANEGVR